MEAGSSCSLVAKILQPIRRAGCWEVYKLPKEPNEESYAVSMKRVNVVVSVSPPFPVSAVRFAQGSRACSQSSPVSSGI